MTKYAVQIERWYNVEADNDEEAVEKALELDLLHRTKPLINVTDLDSCERAYSDQP